MDVLELVGPITFRRSTSFLLVVYTKRKVLQMKVRYNTQHGLCAFTCEDHLHAVTRDVRRMSDSPISQCTCASSLILRSTADLHPEPDLAEWYRSASRALSKPCKHLPLSKKGIFCSEDGRTRPWSWLGA